MVCSVHPNTRALVFDANVPADDPVSLNRFVPGAVPAKDIRDMVEKLKGSNNKYHLIVVSGHGAPDAQGVGSGRTNTYSKGKDFTAGHLSDIANEIDQLKDVFFPPAKNHKYPSILFLAGCEVGENSNLTEELSLKLKDVCVIASSTEVSTIRTGKHSVCLGAAINSGKPNGPIDLFRCSISLNGETYGSSEFLELSGYQHQDLIREMTEWD